MRELWQQLEAELKNLTPDLLTQLYPGADEITIAQAEQCLGFALPEEVKAFFREHNGSEGILFGNWVLFSLEDVCREWHALKDLHPQADFEGKDDSLEKWNPSWLPLMRADYGFLSVKVSLPPNGQAGCVFIHDQDSGFVRFFDDLSTFLAMVTNDLKTGGYRYDEQTHRLRSTHLQMALHPINELELWEGNEGQVEGLTRVAYPGLACLSYQRNYADQIHPALERTIEQSCNVILTTIGHLAPTIRRSLVHEKVSFQELERVEEAMQIRFPEEIKIWYVSCGVRSQDKNGFLDWWDWYSLENIYNGEWQVQQRESTNPLLPRPFPFPEKYRAIVDPKVQLVQWHPRWLPFMYHPDGSIYCVDLAPTTQGQVGQIILLNHLGLPYRSNQLDTHLLPPLLWVAPSVRAFLAVLSQDLMEGKYFYDEKSHMFWSQEGLAYVEEDPNLVKWLDERRRPLRKGNGKWEDDREGNSEGIDIFTDHRHMFRD